MGSVSITDIGKRLREAREKKSLTIEQVYRQTHIQPTIISAIEDGKAEEILNPTYVRSFLKEYARALGLDSAAILKDYLSLHPQPVTPRMNLGKFEERQGPAPGIIIAITIKAIVIIFLALLIIFFFRKTVGFFKGAHAGRARPAATAQHSNPKSGKPEETSGSFNIPRGTPIKMVIMVKQAVMVQVERDGDVLFRRVLTKGMRETFVAENKFVLSIGKAEAVRISVNGNPVVLPAKGPIRKLEITRKGAKIR